MWLGGIGIELSGAGKLSAVFGMYCPYIVQTRIPVLRGQMMDDSIQGLKKDLSTLLVKAVRA